MRMARWGCRVFTCTAWVRGLPWAQPFARARVPTRKSRTPPRHANCGWTRWATGLQDRGRV